MSATPFFSSRRSQALRSLLKFHDDQRGMESLQILMILCVAAVCLIAVKVWWDSIVQFANLAIEILVEN